MKMNADTYPIGENHPDPFMLLSPETGQLIWMNSAAEAWLRQPLTAMVGRQVQEFGKGFEEISKHVKLDDTSAISYRGHDLIVNVRRVNFICEYKIFATSAGTALHLTFKEMGTGRVHATGPEQSVTSQPSSAPFSLRTMGRLCITNSKPV